MEPKGTSLFFYEAGWSKFLLYWTRNPTWFKEWPRSAPSVEEQEIYSLFDQLPRRLPTWKLLIVYKSSQRWTNFQCMFTLFFVSVGLLVFANVFFLGADIMTKFFLRSTDTMAAFCAKALQQGKGRGRDRCGWQLVRSWCDRPLCCWREQEEKEKGGWQHRYYHQVSRWHPNSSNLLGVFVVGRWCRPLCCCCRRTPQTPMAPLSLLGGNLQFSRGVRVGLPLVAKNLLTPVLK